MAGVWNARVSPISMFFTPIVGATGAHQAKEIALLRARECIRRAGVRLNEICQRLHP